MKLNFKQSAFALSFVATFLFIGIQNTQANIPSIGVQFSDGSCNIQVGTPQFTPVTGGDSAPASDSNSYQPNCIKTKLQSSGGSFDEDFRFAIRMGDTCGGPWGSWQYTPWASVGTGWSPWVAAPSKDPSCYQIRVEKRPLSTGGTLQDVQVGMQLGEYNPLLSPPPSSTGCTQHQMFSSGAWSGWGWAETHCRDGNISDTPDVARIYLKATVIAPLDAIPFSDNIPSSFTQKEEKTIGSDRNALSIVMKNTGRRWDSDQSAAQAGSAVGTCEVDTDGDGIFDAPNLLNSNVDKSCTLTYNFSSSKIRLKHITTSFNGVPQVVPYSKPVQITRFVRQYQYCPEPLDPNSDTNCTVGICPLQSRLIPFIKEAHAQLGCDSYLQYDQTQSGSGNVAQNETVSFPMDSLTAPENAGTYTESWKMIDTSNSTFFGTQFDKVISVASGLVATLDVSQRQFEFRSSSPTVGSALIMNAGSASSSMNVTCASSAPWLIIDSCPAGPYVAGDSSANQPFTVNVNTADATIQGEGTYNATINISGTPNTGTQSVGNTPVSVGITYTVPGPDDGGEESDYTLSTAPANQVVSPGDSADYDVWAAPEGTATADDIVQLDIAFPSGAGLSWRFTNSLGTWNTGQNPQMKLNGERATFTIFTSGSTPTQNHSFTLQSTGVTTNIKDIEHDARVSITPSRQDYGLQCPDTSQAPIAVAQGLSRTVSVSVISIKNFNQNVTLSTAPVYAWLTTTFTPNPVTVPANGLALSNLRFQPTESAPTGTYTIAVNGRNSNGNVESCNFRMAVTTSSGDIEEIIP